MLPHILKSPCNGIMKKTGTLHQKWLLPDPEKKSGGSVQKGTNGRQLSMQESREGTAPYVPGKNRKTGNKKQENALECFGIPFFSACTVKIHIKIDRIILQKGEEK